MFVHDGTLLKGVGAVGVSEKISFLESFSDHRKMLGVTIFYKSYTFVLSILWFIFKKKLKAKLVWDPFSTFSKYPQYDNFSYIDKLKLFFFFQFELKKKLSLKIQERAFERIKTTHSPIFYHLINEGRILLQ